MSPSRIPAAANMSSGRTKSDRCKTPAPSVVANICTERACPEAISTQASGPMTTAAISVVVGRRGGTLAAGPSIDISTLEPERQLGQNLQIMPSPACARNANVEGHACCCGGRWTSTSELEAVPDRRRYTRANGATPAPRSGTAHDRHPRHAAMVLPAEGGCRVAVWVPVFEVVVSDGERGDTPG